MTSRSRNSQKKKKLNGGLVNGNVRMSITLSDAQAQRASEEAVAWSAREGFRLFSADVIRRWITAGERAEADPGPTPEDIDDGA